MQLSQICNCQSSDRGSDILYGAQRRSRMVRVQHVQTIFRTCSHEDFGRVAFAAWQALSEQRLSILAGSAPCLPADHCQALPQIPNSGGNPRRGFATSAFCSIRDPDPKQTRIYAEFTQLQNLLHQYQKNLAQVGKASSNFHGHLWRRKSALGWNYTLQSAQEEGERDREKLASSEDELVEFLEHADIHELTGAVDSLSHLDQRPDARILNAVVRSLQKNCEKHAATGHDIVMVLRGLAVLAYQPTGAVLDQISYHIKDKLPNFSAKDMSRLMNSMAAFGRLHFPLLKAVADEVTKRCKNGEFTSEALADFLYSFAILGCEAQRMTDCILERIVFDLKTMSPAALSQLVFGLHLLNHRDAVTDVFLDALAEAALLQMHHFSAKQLATLAYNYGTLNHWGRNDQELLDAITIRMLHQHSELTPSQIPNLVWALARASYNSPRTNALLAAVTQHATGIADQMTPSELARLLHSLSALSFYDKSLFEGTEGLIQANLAGFTPEELTMIMTSYGRLVHSGTSVVPAIVKSLESRYTELSAQGLCGLVWGAAVLGELSAPTFRAAVELLSAKPLSDFTARDFMRLYQAFLLLDGKMTAQNQHCPKLTQWLHEYAVRSFKDKLYLDRHTGIAQQDICRCLMRLGVSYTLENVVDGILAVDIVLKLPEHPNVAIKMEQITKYTTSRPRRALADAWITRWLLNARGWNLICISEHEWVRLRDFEVKLAFVEDKIKAITNPPMAIEAAAA